MRFTRKDITQILKNALNDDTEVPNWSQANWQTFTDPVTGSIIRMPVQRLKPKFNCEIIEGE